MSDPVPALRSSAPGPLLALLHLALFLIGSLFWMLALGLAGSAYLFLMRGPEALTGAEDPMVLMGPGLLGLLTFLQGVGLAGLAAALGGLLPAASSREWVAIPRGIPAIRERLRAVFAWRRGPRAWILAGALGALTIGFFPAWIAETLLKQMPDDYVSPLEVIPSLLLSDDPGRFVMVFGIVIGAPLFEELVFRGYLWKVLERAGPPVLCWLGTSALFALFHQDPIHVLSLVPTALYIGWLRWVSGSIWPAIAAHFVNNSLSMVILWTTQDLDPSPLPLPVALLGLAFSVAICAMTWLWRRRSLESPR